MDKVKVALGGLLVAAGLVVGAVVVTPLVAEARDCSDNAVVRCGVVDINDLRSKYNADASTQNIFAAYGLTSAVINGATAKTGTTTKNGDVIVDGKVVATNAHSAGRQYISGSTRKESNGTVYYDSPNQTAFRTNSIAIIAFFDGDGKFIGGVMNDCGNPLTGTSTPVPPKPVYACDSLTAAKVSRTEFRFATAATAKDGAVIQDYVYNFGDGATQTAGATTNHTYAKAGTYTASVTVRVKVGDTIVNAPGNCVTKVTVDVENCPIPGKEKFPVDSPECKEDKWIKVCDTRTNTIKTIKEEDFDKSYMTTDFSKCEKIKVCDTTTNQIIEIYKSEMKDTYTTDLSKCAPVPPPELPKTGPADALMSIIGVGGLVGATLAYIASRRAI